MLRHDRRLLMNSFVNLRAFASSTERMSARVLPRGVAQAFEIREPRLRASALALG